MKDFAENEQLSLFDIVLPANMPEKTEKAFNTNGKIPPSIPTFAKVPDEEYNAPPITGLPSVDSILKKVQNTSYKIGLHELLSATIECGAIAVSNQFDRVQVPKREERYLQIMKSFDADTQKLIQDIFGDIVVLLMHMTNPHVGFNDYLGALYMGSETSNSKAGQFFTPYNVSKLCAQLSINEVKINEAVEQDKILMLNEPACGAGGLILAAADVLYNQYHFNIARNLLVECSDIDSKCVYMTYLQLSFAGIPAIVYQRDTLTMKTWQRWETPAYIMQWLRFRNILKG